MPNTVRSRQQPIVLRVRVVDTRGYAVRDALVFARSTPLLTTSSGEVRTGRDGWARLQLRPHADFPLDGRSVQFWIRVRKQSDALLAGVSNRRLVQVATGRLTVGPSGLRAGARRPEASESGLCATRGSTR